MIRSIPDVFCLLRRSSSDEPTLKHLLRGESDTLSLGDVGKDDWVNFNPKGVGFYRVSYPKVE